MNPDDYARASWTCLDVAVALDIGKISEVAVKLEGEIFGAKSLAKKFYVDIFKENNVVLNQTQAYFTYRKMTADQTKTEFKDGLEIASKIYGRKVPSFRVIWEKYGKKIEACGYGMYPKIVVLVAQKLG